MDFYAFSVTEALFWIILSVTGYLLCNLEHQRYRQLAIYASIAFAAFGLSDVAEILHGSFLEPGLVWLFVWKIINIVAILFAFGWYMFLRGRQ